MLSPRHASLALSDKRIAFPSCHKVFFPLNLVLGSASKTAARNMGQQHLITLFSSPNIGSLHSTGLWYCLCYLLILSILELTPKKCQLRFTIFFIVLMPKFGFSFILSVCVSGKLSSSSELKKWVQLTLNMLSSTPVDSVKCS